MNQFKPVRLYGLVVLLALGVFTWATVTGTRLLGDDDESVEKRQGYRSGGRSGGRVGRTHFYHK
ncbi:hypothetical protein GGR92_003149 [Spirosoma lacussanchae]|uniref:hypothetical protein n=1 Tax=Spirosoma lacussanchae TaxID=1884249 RepID=UPI00110913F6|nr:hypothetical protein [Spirosoma lacussanchae]